MNAVTQASSLLSTVGAQASPDVDVLTSIYNENQNIAIWQRPQDERMLSSVKALIESQQRIQIASVVRPESVLDTLATFFDATGECNEVCEDIAELVDMFCGLFELKEAGLKLSVIDHTMCPRFHVDWVPCRLLTTYDGEGTQWLPHDLVDRSKLGLGNQGLPDERSGLFRSAEDIRQLNPGDVALLKGENWIGNEGAGLVHRSPQLPYDKKRLLLSLDFTNI